MKILQVHNYYQQSGGEDTVVKNEFEYLVSKGHKVVQFNKTNESIKGLRLKLELLFNTHYSDKSYKEFLEMLKKENPDIVHVHNFFPLFTPSIFDVCNKLKIPIVLTLHNFRIFHPNGLLLFNGKTDLRGLVGSAYKCIPDKVYRNSYIQTAVVAHMIEYHKKRNTWNTKIDKIIPLSQTSKEIFLKGGIKENKMVVKPNFTKDVYDQIPVSADLKKRGYILYVGRISEEKGIKQLLESYERNSIKNELIIIGDGPIKSKLENLSKDNIHISWLGSLAHKKVLEYMKNATALIFPSICMENFPMTVVESMSMGVPVLASNIGAAKSIIENKVDGLLYNPFESKELAEVIKIVSDCHENTRMGENARKTFLSKYTSAVNYLELIQIYQDAIREKNN